MSMPTTTLGQTAAHTLYARLQHRYVGASAFALDVEIVLGAGITVLFGASGSGKTTLLDCLAGLLTPTVGRIALGEKVLFDSEQHRDVPTRQRALGYLFQNLALFPHLSVRQNVEYGIHRLPKSEQRHRSDALLNAFRIEHLAERRPGDISGGERQRVALARALVTNPGFLLLDEPLTALDLPTKSAIVADLRRWNREHRIPVLFVTHDREEVYALAERVLVIEKGTIVAHGTPHEVLEKPLRESVAQLAGFENLFGATVIEKHLDQGTMTCRLLPPIDDPANALEKVFLQNAGVEIEAPLTNASLGEHLRIAVRAGDILIATEKPRSLSARNVLPATIESLRLRNAMVIVTATSGDSRVKFEVHLTPGAVQALALSEGSSIWLVAKTHSIHVVER